MSGRPAPLPAAALALCAALLLGACAAPPAGPAAGDPLARLTRYIAPAPGQPSARLLVRGQVPAGDRFVVVRHQDALQCARPELLTEGASQQPAPAVNIAAGVLTTLEFTLVRPGEVRSCLNLSFTPQPGRTYLMSGQPVGAGCSVQLVDATQPDKPASLHDSVLRTAAGQRCLPMAQARTQEQERRANAAPSITGGQVNGEAVLNPRATAADLQGLIRP